MRRGPGLDKKNKNLTLTRKQVFVVGGPILYPVYIRGKTLGLLRSIPFTTYSLFLWTLREGKTTFI